ncbi:putative membrane protein [Streptomyces davaonensis JCM 4913]|uniref:Putative membrane protein n=1 Tax=Streptomyces davaonensis (strain DSM 101723 / JCM 4913 / KCC S-0913 / 768) TaxID=1214101 RepID=K4RD46_STRDJ|nr:putative membrane protein [Streptomyces davaonensis JCM 4913]
MVCDRQWAPDLLSAVGCSGVVLGLLLLVDRGADTLTSERGAVWVTLAALLFAVLCPARVTAGEGWLETRRLLVTRRVRTDRLVSVHCLDGVAQRLLLRDAFGDRVEIDPQVLIGNPDLWHRLDEDTRRSIAAGSLLCGRTALRRLAERIDRRTVETVFRVSGLD